MDESFAFIGRHPESIMIENVVSLVNDPIKDSHCVPHRRESIMNWPADESGASGDQDVHARWLAGRGAGRETSKRQPPSTLRTEISPSWD